MSMMPKRVVPTAPVKMMLPVPAVKVKSSAPAVVPFTVPLKVISPAPPTPVDKITSVVKVTPVANVISPSVVVMLPPILFKLPTPPLDCLKPSPGTTSPVLMALVVVNKPLFTKATYPPALIPPSTLNAVPVRSTFPVVVTRPFRSVVPLPAVCVRLAALIAAAVTSLAEVIVIAPRSCVAPTTPVRVMSPEPAISVRFCAKSVRPSTVPPKLIAPFAVLITEVVPANVKPVLLSPKVTVLPAVLICPLRVIALGAVATTPPVKFRISPTSLPSASVPVLRKVVLLATVFVVPVIETL